MVEIETKDRSSPWYHEETKATSGRARGDLESSGHDEGRHGGTADAEEEDDGSRPTPAARTGASGSKLSAR